MMSNTDADLQTEFQFGSTTVKIIQGNILAPGVEVDSVVSTDDNYLTMASGVARLLAERAGPEYIREAQAECPVKPGTVVVTEPYGLPDHGLDVECVLHGAVIDYDTYDLPLDELVSEVTANCLVKMEQCGLRSVLLPAFATGAGGLPMTTCARHMCRAIKAHLAQERPIEEVYVILYLPSAANAEPAVVAEAKGRNRRFIREANLVLGVPYNPAATRYQVRDFYDRETEIQQLEAVLTGLQGQERHAVILGGPRVGKATLLDQLFVRAQQGDSRLVKVTFGRMHANTPASFVYRKFLAAINEGEDNEDIKKHIRDVYADPDVNCERFVNFLDAYPDRYRQIMFLIVRLPRLLDMEGEVSSGTQDVRAFWSDLDELGERVRFVCTARDDEQFQRLVGRFEQYTETFRDSVAFIRLACVTEQTARNWIDGLYQDYLGRDAGDLEHRFFAAEAGRHPYLISLLGHALIEALKPDTLDNPGRDYTSQNALARFFQAARSAVEEPRRAFFELLMREALDAGDRFELRTLAEAVEMEAERESLVRSAAEGDPDAGERLATLLENPRQPLHGDRLRQLEGRGYLVDAGDPQSAEFMADSFAEWTAEYFGVGRRADQDEQPQDVVISFLGPEREAGSQQPLITTMFRQRGARIVTAETPLRHKDLFMKNFDSYVRNVLHPGSYPERGDFHDLEAVGDFVLDYFTTGRVRGYLKNLPDESTIALEIDQRLRDIPWELMLEAVYQGEIPFRVGRSTIGPDQPTASNPPVRGGNRVRALLIGNPTDELEEAEAEVQRIAALLRDDGRFTVDDEDLLIRSEDCGLLRVLNRLRSGEYGLIHYSGHSVFDGDQSAWVLADGKINTFDLTSSLRDAPPVLVFSSSCESAEVGGAEAGEPRPIKYENQTFDLPSAFLQAGVEAYVGTLWEVEEVAARRFAEAFYRRLVIEGYSLGECLRLAKTDTREPRDRINWLAFLLYGNPRVRPGDLFPALRGQ